MKRINKIIWGLIMVLSLFLIQSIVFADQTGSVNIKRETSISDEIKDMNYNQLKDYLIDNHSKFKTSDEKYEFDSNYNLYLSTEYKDDLLIKSIPKIGSNAESTKKENVIITIMNDQFNDVDEKEEVNKLINSKIFERDREIAINVTIGFIIFVIMLGIFILFSLR